MDGPLEGTVETHSLGSFQNNESIFISDPYLRQNYEMFSYIPLSCMQWWMIKSIGSASNSRHQDTLQLQNGLLLNSKQHL